MTNTSKILVIDDHKMIHSLIKGILEHSGFAHFDYAYDGSKGIEMDKENDYDLITCDISMKGLNGIETVKKLLENNPDKKILMISVMGQHAYIKEAIEAGARDYLIKPFTPEMLIEKVKVIFSEG